jgi:predicted DNA-binding transcriptional regulator YafY
MARQIPLPKPLERNRQLIRQWKILQQLEGWRTLAELAGAVADGGVTTRTIRRDLEALEAARFPIYSDVHEDGRTRWRLLTKRVIPARVA